MVESEVLVQVSDPTGVNRQIKPREEILKKLKDCYPEIERAIADATSLSQRALDKTSSSNSWQVREFELRFGITVTAEAGAIVSRIAGEATFEITVTIGRDRER